MAVSVWLSSNNTIPFPKFLHPNYKLNDHNFVNNLVNFPKTRRIRGVNAMGSDNLAHTQRSRIKKRDTPAPLGLWDRFPTARTIQQMMDTMDRMVEDPLAFNTSWPSTQPNNVGGDVRVRTPWEIKDGENDYKMRFDMPGMTKEDVKVWIEEKMLVIKAEKVVKNVEEHGGEDDGNGENWSIKSYGRYSYRIALPENVEFEKIKAEVRDGVLYVTIPKASSSSKVFDINVM